MGCVQQRKSRTHAPLACRACRHASCPFAPLRGQPAGMPGRVEWTACCKRMLCAPMWPSELHRPPRMLPPTRCRAACEECPERAALTQARHTWPRFTSLGAAWLHGPRPHCSLLCTPRPHTMASSALPCRAVPCGPAMPCRAALYPSSSQGAHCSQTAFPLYPLHPTNCMHACPYTVASR